PECSASQRMQKALVSRGGALRIDSLSFGLPSPCDSTSSWVCMAVEYPVGRFGSNLRTFNPCSMKEIRMEKVSRRTAMKVAAAGTVAVGTAVLSGTAAGDEAKAPKLWTLEGELKVHPKFLYRYYLALLGTGQICALYGADRGREQDQLARLKLPIGVKVRGV